MWDWEHEPSDPLVWAHFSFQVFSLNCFSLPYHFMGNPFPNRDILCWNLERKNSVKTWVAICCICLFHLCYYAAGLILVAQHRNHQSFPSACLPCYGVAKVYAGFFSIRVRCLIYSWLLLRSLLQYGNLRDLRSHCHLPWLPRLLVWFSGWNMS